MFAGSFPFLQVMTIEIIIRHCQWGKATGRASDEHKIWLFKSFSEVMGNNCLLKMVLTYVFVAFLVLNTWLYTFKNQIY